MHPCFCCVVVARDGVVFRKYQGGILISTALAGFMVVPVFGTPGSLELRFGLIGGGRLVLLLLLLLMLLLFLSWVCAG